MKHLAIMILLVGISLRPLPAQTVKTNPVPQQPAGRASYDPMAHGKQTGQPKSIVETTLAGVNPQDKDYGSVVADWRKTVFENTLQAFYFWGLLGTALALGISIVGNGWLLRQRDQRLAVSADIVSQLYNAYATSRARTLEVIGKHNRLVEKYDRLDTEAAELRVTTVGGPGQEPKASADFSEALDAKPAEYHMKTVIEDQIPGATIETAASPEAGDLREKLEELQTKLQRKEAQLKAKDNQITNLRTRLRQAHDSLEGERGQKAGKITGENR
jgi:hypothetical protein